MGVFNSVVSDGLIGYLWLTFTYLMMVLAGVEWRECFYLTTFLLVPARDADNVDDAICCLHDTEMPAPDHHQLLSLLPPSCPHLVLPTFTTCVGENYLITLLPPSCVCLSKYLITTYERRNNLPNNLHNSLQFCTATDEKVHWTNQLYHRHMILHRRWRKIYLHFQSHK